MSQPGDVNDPLSPDYIEDYDYFDVKRKARLAAIQEEKLQIDVKQRKELKKKALHWLENGKKAMGNLSIGVSGVRSLLEPHHFTKANVINFNDGMELLEYKARGTRCCRHTFPLANRVLHVTRADPLKHRKWFHSKANLIVWKFCVMKEIRAAFQRAHPFEYEYRPAVSETRLLRYLFRIQMDNVPIDRSISEELKRKRAIHKVVVAKLKLIHDTQAACENIFNCKSRQHTNPKGCSNCGVVYIGGMIGGGTQYVQSISRDTGLSSLVTLDYEVEQLKKEDIAQRDIVEQVEIDLFAYESVVLGIVRINIQAWWSFVLVWKRYKRKEKRIKKSLELHRRRRLVILKRHIDALIKEPAPLDMPYLCEVYCDIIPELMEYASLQSELKAQRVLKWSKYFRRKLVAGVEVAREKKHQEYLRLLALPKPPRPIVFKTLPACENTSYICYRLECKMRKFLTKDRFDIHMNVHYKSDKVRYQRYDANRAAKAVRDDRSAEVLHRIELSRDHLTGGGGGGDGGSSGSVSTFDAGGEEDEHASAEDDASSVGDHSIAGDKMGVFSAPTTSGNLNPANPHIDIETALDNHSGEQLSTPSSSTISRRTGFARRKELPFRTTQEPGSGEVSRSAGSPKSPQPHHIRGSFSTTTSAVLPGRSGVKQKNSVHAQDSEMFCASAQEMLNWASMTHIYSLHSLHNEAMYSLELVAKHGDITVAQRVPLDRPLIRIGTHSSCECVISTSGSAKRDGKIAKVHCLLFCPTYSGSTVLDAANRQVSGQLTLVDNSSAWGTYVVSAAGTRKAPVKVTAGLVLTPGQLVCIGVCKDGPSEISATEANQACVVYRVRCLEKEIV